MKKIINGKKYDTETAELICEWDNGRMHNDFYYESRDLYRKKTGEFFIHGQGGAASSFSENRGQYSCGGETIIPVSIEEVKCFLEKYGTVEQYEKIFGEVEE